MTDPTPKPQLVLLGPQRLAPTVGTVVEELGLKGPIATITAGWQEREDETDELHQELGVPAVDLRIYHRCEDAHAADPELFDAHRHKQDRLKGRQAIYRARLDATLGIARRLQHWSATPELLEEQFTSAMAVVSALDEEHLDNVATEHAAFEELMDMTRRTQFRKHREELTKILDDCEAVVITGGHIGTLRARMRFFRIVDLLAGRRIIAWSAGAMLLTERVVLYHDRPPQGRGNAELLDHGMGIAKDLVVLPHAKRRLDLDDTDRVALFAQRFAPAVCVGLDEEGRVDWDGERWVGSGTARQLHTDGSVTRMEAP